MKLQKLVYLAHEDWLRVHDEPFLDANPEVWQYGPVFADLYHLLKHHRAENIMEPEAPDDDTSSIEDDPEVSSMLEQTWDQYRRFPATFLSNMTHKPGTPWYQIAQRHRFKVPFGTEIPPELIKRYVRTHAPEALAR